MLDDGDKMRMKDFKMLFEFYLRNNTLKVSDDEVIMEIFSYFVNRDMILLASPMQHMEQEEENTMLSGNEEEKQNEMETEIAPIVDLDFDILSEAEKFFKNYKGREPKNVWVEFVTFESNSIDMAALDNLIFQKSKDFFVLEKRNGGSPKLYGLMFTEENAKLNWINRRLADLHVNLPQSFKQLEQFRDGHLFF